MAGPIEADIAPFPDLPSIAWFKGTGSGTYGGCNPLAGRATSPLAITGGGGYIGGTLARGDAMTVHIGAEPGQIAETVLLPGDPYRARWAAETFLDGPELVNEIRGMLAYTGTWNGHRVTIHGTGMGMPSLSIYANELIRDHNVQTLIRIGSCGAMQSNIELRDVILAMAATSLSTPSRGILREMNYAPSADFGLLLAAWREAQGSEVGLHVGGIYSSDVFYDERPDLNEIMVRHGILAVEMEAAELYTLAARHGRRALAILTVSDHLVTGEALPAGERERNFGDMVRLALAAAFS